MSSASKVGEIFTAAGAAFSKLGDLTMQLHPTAEPSPSSTQIRTQMKRKSFEDAGLPQPTDSPKKVVMEKKLVAVAAAPTTAAVGGEPQAKKQKNDVTLSALNAPESDVDIEGDSSSSKKLEFDSDVDSSML
ncbi:chromatin complexes subunit BAP18-like isoform X3 [Mizuhopecten yessoensis]|uniref:chromatin complexes subunit BAP18-like isoform X3 n=1 Tax=Mizuhopecten yessoensis TaxID=6573 RepID=UPI000B458C90|nr:chromatin complexes subunit BAP18-like isoform X3 [Mizuhopecten yessoensis]